MRSPSCTRPVEGFGRQTRFDYFLLGIGLIAILLTFHNYALPILPRVTEIIEPEKIFQIPGHPPHVYAYLFDRSESNRPLVNRSTVILSEGGIPYSNAHTDPRELLIVGGKRFVHEPGRILFANTYNSDPRINKQIYALSYPPFHSRTWGQGALASLGSAIALLWWRRRKGPIPARNACAESSRWPIHLGAACLVLATGLYLNTGTLSPYAITTFAFESPNSFLYNPDHLHFRALYDFVDQAPKETWDKAIMLRRILFPVLAWPAMKLGGFEFGGTIAAILLNVVGLVWAGIWMQRRIGRKGAILALWLLALYPGAAYWGGLPYPYALISPLSVLLLLALDALRSARGARFVAIALLLGFGYLAYDFIAYFGPASVLLLIWSRRPLAGMAAGLLQILPLGAWIITLTLALDQPPTNSNSASYGMILHAYRELTPDLLVEKLAALPEIAAVVFFGSNFLFIPFLFGAVVLVNLVTSRVRLDASECCLLFVATGIFLFNHLAPDYGGWQMKGAWISRIYQPIFPVFILFIARWWQSLPSLELVPRIALHALLTATCVGNFLIICGPILSNPWRVSETAYVRFYNHNENHWIYEDNLRKFGRRPLGFQEPKP